MVNGKKIVRRSTILHDSQKALVANKVNADIMSNGILPLSFELKKHKK